MQRIQYIDNYSMNNSCLTVRKLAEPQPLCVQEITQDVTNIRILSTKDNSLNAIFEDLYENMSISENVFAVETEEVNEERILAFAQACKMFGCPVKLYMISRDLNVSPRQELYELLYKIWGYNSFRDLT